MAPFFLLPGARLAAQAAPATRIALPDDGWRLWPDTKAAWHDDAVYLPADVHLDSLPVNAPTGGWAMLTAAQGIPVTLPSTAEQQAPGSACGTADAIAKTGDPKLYQTQRFGKAGGLDFVLSGLPPGPATVTLYFAETFQTTPGARKFDVVINGKTVLRDFDIYAKAGGKDIAVQKTFTVNAPQGTVEICPGSVAADNATFAALKATSGGKVVAVYFGGGPYTGDDHEADADARTLPPVPSSMTGWWAAPARSGWGPGTSSAPTPSMRACP